MSQRKRSQFARPLLSEYQDNHVEHCLVYSRYVQLRAVINIGHSFPQIWEIFCRKPLPKPVNRVKTTSKCPWFSFLTMMALACIHVTFSWQKGINFVVPQGRSSLNIFLARNNFCQLVHKIRKSIPVLRRLVLAVRFFQFKDPYLFSPVLRIILGDDHSRHFKSIGQSRFHKESIYAARLLRGVKRR